LDATDAVIEDACRLGCEFLLTHHPLLFHSIKQVTDDDFIGRRIVKMLENNMSYYAMHTNFDAAPDGMADLAAVILRLHNSVPMEEMQADLETPWGIGKTGNLSEPMTLEELAEHVKRQFQLKQVQVYPAVAMSEEVKRVAVCPGSGRSMFDAANATGAQVLITGDIGHHEGIDMAAQGISVIDGGHYGLEKIFIPVMADRIQTKFPELQVCMAPMQMPYRIL
jgi:dinuclear metal center YbgI/SA1388 family protein